MLNPADHTYQGIITSKTCRSVTTILAEAGWIEKKWFRDGRAELGTQCHRMIDAYNKRLKFTAPAIYLRYLDPYKSFLKHTNAEVIGSEIEIEDISLGVSGTMDILLRLPGSGVGVLDVKFSQCGYLPSHDLQTAAYARGLLFHPKYKNLKIDWRGGIIFSPDCVMPRLINHDRMPDADRVWQATAVFIAAKHRHKIAMEKIDKENGWVA